MHHSIHRCMHWITVLIPILTRVFFMNVFSYLIQWYLDPRVQSRSKHQLLGSYIGNLNFQTIVYPNIWLFLLISWRIQCRIWAIPIRREYLTERNIIRNWFAILIYIRSNVITLRYVPTWRSLGVVDIIMLCFVSSVGHAGIYNDRQNLSWNLHSQFERFCRKKRNWLLMCSYAVGTQNRQFH